MAISTFVIRLGSIACLLLLAACGVPATGSTSTNQQVPSPTAPTTSDPGTAETPPAITPVPTQAPPAITPVPTQAPPAITPDTGETPPAATPDASAGTDVPQGSWQLVDYGPADAPIAVVAGSTVTIIFEPGGKAGGAAGCNSYSGTYKLDGQSFSVSEVGSTMMACADDKVMQQESAYLAALQSATALHQDGDNLTIDYAGGRLHFTRIAPAGASPLEGRTWQFDMFVNGDTISSTAPDATITAKFADGRVSGSTGCNQYSADYTLAGTALTIGAVEATEMACDEAIMTQEQQFVQAIGAATGLVIEGDQLRLDYPGGALVFRAVE